MYAASSYCNPIYIKKISNSLKCLQMIMMVFDSHQCTGNQFITYLLFNCLPGLCRNIIWIRCHPPRCSIWQSYRTGSPVLFKLLMRGRNAGWEELMSALHFHGISWKKQEWKKKKESETICLAARLLTKLSGLCPHMSQCSRPHSHSTLCMRTTLQLTGSKRAL